MNFLKTLLIILLVYFGLRLLWRFLRPHFLRWLQRKAQRHFNDMFGQDPFQQPPTAKEGEVTIDQMPQQRKKPKADPGQYVDYEEID
jgi:hypothetical protein